MMARMSASEVPLRTNSLTTHHNAFDRSPPKYPPSPFLIRSWRSSARRPFLLPPPVDADGPAEDGPPADAPAPAHLDGPLRSVELVNNIVEQRVAVRHL